MRYISLKENLKDFTLFTLNDIKKLDPNFGRSRLNEWQYKGYIKKIIKNFYIFSDLKLDDGTLFEIANKIYSPSYISSEMALSYYNLIPETVYLITSVSTRKTCSFNTDIGSFSYRNIKETGFFGYNLVKNKDKYFKIANPEKAIIDFLYYRKNLDSESAIEQLRINTEELKLTLNEKKFKEYLNIINNRKLKKRANLLWEYVNYA
ncbi:MAG: hypothetical protein M1308_02535 [Actinobacteria bacterium]|nr:hypothetical protein [Actinomycetota bacterium]